MLISGTTDDGFQWKSISGGIEITGYTGESKEIIIPSNISGYPVISIGDEVFYGKDITSVIFPERLKSIGKEAFTYCLNLTDTIVLPKSVTTLGDRALTIISSKISVDEENQYFKSEDGVLYTKDGTTLISYPISKEDSTFTIPDTVTTVGMCAFQMNKNLTKIIIPQSVKVLKWCAFRGCSNATLYFISSNGDIQNQGANPDDLPVVWDYKDDGSIETPLVPMAS